DGRTADAAATGHRLAHLRQYELIATADCILQDAASHCHASGTPKVSHLIGAERPETNVSISLDEHRAPPKLISPLRRRPPLLRWASSMVTRRQTALYLDGPAPAGNPFFRLGLGHLSDGHSRNARHHYRKPSHHYGIVLDDPAGAAA